MNVRSGCPWLSEWMGVSAGVFCVSCDRALLFVRFLPAGTRLKGGIDPCVRSDPQELITALCPRGFWVTDELQLGFKNLLLLEDFSPEEVAEIVY